VDTEGLDRHEVAEPLGPDDATVSPLVRCSTSAQESFLALPSATCGPPPPSRACRGAGLGRRTWSRGPS